MPEALHHSRKGKRSNKLAMSYCCVKSPSPRPWWARGREHGGREARRHAAAASGRETKGPAGAAAAGGISVTCSQPTQCDIGTVVTAPMSHRVGPGQRGPGRRAGGRPIIRPTWHPEWMKKISVYLDDADVERLRR